MLDTIQAMSLLAIMEIVGPVLLAAALIYGVYHSRRRRGQQQQADAATRHLYTQEEARRSD
jgi:heme exporter protein D